MRIVVRILSVAPRRLLKLILRVLELLLVARLADFLGLAMLALGIAELLLDVGNESLLGDLVVIGVDDGVDRAHVVLLAALASDAVLAVEVAAARREQVAVAAASLLVVELGLELRVDEDLRLRVDVVLVVGCRILTASILHTRQ